MLRDPGAEDSPAESSKSSKTCIPGLHRLHRRGAGRAERGSRGGRDRRGHHVRDGRLGVPRIVRALRGAGLRPLRGGESPGGEGDRHGARTRRAAPRALRSDAPARATRCRCSRRTALVPRVRHRTHAFELTRSIVARSDSAYAILGATAPRTSCSYEGLPILASQIDPAAPAGARLFAWARGTSSRRCVPWGACRPLCAGSIAAGTPANTESERAILCRIVLFDRIIGAAG